MDSRRGGPATGTSVVSTAPVTRCEELVVVIPAHNEEDALGGTLVALERQTLAPGHVVVVADNCDDDTSQVALRHGVQVIATEANRDRKAGALNQALGRLAARRPTYVLVLDADTRLAPDFVAKAIATLESDSRIGAVSGLFVGDRPRSLLEQLQANEYARYRTQILTTGRVAVVTGTASVFRFEALCEVAARRGSLLPGTLGDVYDRSAITEDSELTLALRALGWRLASRPECECTTELMPTWGDLHRQRVRWYKGMLDNLRSYGLSRVTAPYVAQQLMIGVGIVTIALLTLLTTAAVASGTFAVQAFWLAVASVFVVNRIVTVWSVGPRGRLIALAVLPEIGYDTALQVAFVRAALRALTRRDVTWNHVALARDRPAGDQPPRPAGALCPGSARRSHPGIRYEARDRAGRTRCTS